MRALLVIRSLVVGGAERQCCNLAIGLVQRGHTVALCALGSHGPLSPGLVEQGVEHPTLEHRGPKDFPRTASRLRKLIESFRPDVIYSFMPVSNILCAWSVPGWARDRLVWGVRASWMDHPAYGVIPRLALRLERLLKSRPRLVITNSESGAAYYRTLGFAPERMRVIENSIDTLRFAYDAERRSLLRQQQRVSESQRVVIIASRIDVIKGYDTFLEAAAAVARSRSDVVFWSIGGGDPPLLAGLQRTAKTLGLAERLTWFGEIKNPNDVASLFCASDLCVSASISEGFPNSVAEALACGLRVVGTDAGDTRRLIGDSGETVPIRDAAAMSRAILRELEHPPMREPVRRDFLARFEPLNLLTRHEALLSDIAVGS